jgi:hypothetical protein
MRRVAEGDAAGLQLEAALTRVGAIAAHLDAYREGFSEVARLRAALEGHCSMSRAD